MANDTLFPHIPLWVQTAVGFGAVALFVIGEWIFSGRFREEREEKDFAEEMNIPWDERFEQANRAIQEVIQSLPDEIRKEAKGILYLLEKWPPEDRPRKSTLGLFRGFEQGKVSRAGGVILIFIGPHHYFCEAEEVDFEKEVRRTYLHELGHHLGLDEGDLEERDL